MNLGKKIHFFKKVNSRYLCGMLLLIVSFSTLSAEKDESYNKRVLSRYSHVVVYQFGKVGSTSLHNLFSKYSKCIHTHNPEPIHKLMKEKKKFLVVNSMRNIFDRNISCLFQNLNRVKELPENYNLADLLRLFPEQNQMEIQNLFNWYGGFNQLLGLHIFEHPFNFNERYYFEKRKGFDVLILRYEDIGRWSKIIEKVLNLKNVKIPKQRVNKHPLYNKFKNAFRYSEEEADLMLSVDYMQHFYTEEERNRFREKHTPF